MVEAFQRQEQSGGSQPLNWETKQCCDRCQYSDS